MMFPTDNLALKQLFSLVLLTCVCGSAMASTDLTPMRSEILLNGKWNFKPQGDSGAETPSEISVPSSWSARPTNIMFGGVTLPELVSAVYERSVEIPEKWAGRRIVLDLRRVSTEAEVSVNGKPCGRVDWPYGEVDITKAVRPGEQADIQITVTARTPEGETWALMGYATEEKKKRTLASRGLIGDVLLKSEPAGARITDVFVKPSVRKKAVDLDIDPATPSGTGIPTCALNPSTSSLALTFLRARPELTYTIEASSTLAPGSWVTIATNPGVAGEEVTVTDPVALESGQPRRFLRLRVTP